jgi:hypothetical protein
MKAITLASVSNLHFAASKLNFTFNMRASRRLKNAYIKSQTCNQLPCQDSNRPLPM